MPAIYQGDKKIVGRYVGEKLIVRAYQGDKLIFDAYSELSGTLPLTVRSRASQVLKNYVIYGTSEGAGVETENLWDFSASTKGLLQNDGSTDANQNYSTSDYIPVTAGQPYTFRALSGYAPGRFVRVAWYDSNSQFVDYLSEIKNAPVGSVYTNSYTAPNNASYARVSGFSIYDSEFMLVPGSTAPSTYIPYGYKLPITVTSNGTTTDYPVYIGDSKLGEEEFADYESGKVWKRTENDFPFAEKGTFAFGDDGNIISDGEGKFTVSIPSAPLGARSTLIPLNRPYTIPQSVDTGGEFAFYLGNNAVKGNLSLAFYNTDGVQIDFWRCSSRWRISTTYSQMTGKTIAYLAIISDNTPGNIELTPMFSKSTNLTEYIPYFQPTDPPVPLPDIALPQAIATIDTEEEFKYHASIKGRINPVHYYAYSINADTAEITYLADNKNFTPAAMGSTTFDYGSWGNAFFMPRPCILKSNGKVDYYLDPNDYSKKLDGTASDISDPTYDGNVMMEFPKIYYKFVPTGDDGEGGTFHCSNVKLDDSYECWCNYDANNNEIDYFYVAAYNAVILDNKMRSLSGYALTQENGADTTTGTAEISAARANNQNGIDEWYTYLLADHQLLTYLATLMCKHVNHQTKFGRGLDSGSTAAKRAYVTGTLNDKGLFWGDTSTGTQGVKIFGIENFYACVWKRAAGLIGTSTGYSYKLTHGTKDGSTATSFNTNGSGYKTIARTKPANGWVTTMHYEPNGFWIPATTGTNRYAVYHWTGNGYVLVGGSLNNGSACGSWYVDLSLGVSLSGWNLSSALSCKPKA